MRDNRGIIVQDEGTWHVFSYFKMDNVGKDLNSNLIIKIIPSLVKRISEFKKLNVKKKAAAKLILTSNKFVYKTGWK